MQGQSTFRSSPPSLPPAGPATKGLMGVLVAVSLLGALLDRRSAMGASWLVFDRDLVLHGEVWRLFTYGFVKIGSPIGLLLSMAALYLFGSNFERRWGSPAYLRFCSLSIVGAAVLALPLGLLFDQTGLFSDRSVFGGPDAAIDALLVALTLEAPNSTVLFGFVLPMRARTFLLSLLGLELISGMMTGVASMGLTLGGMAMGYVLVTQMWRPSLLLQRLRLARIRRRRRTELFVVPPPRGGYRKTGRRDSRLN